MSIILDNAEQHKNSGQLSSSAPIACQSKPHSLRNPGSSSIDVASVHSIFHL